MLTLTRALHKVDLRRLVEGQRHLWPNDVPFNSKVTKKRLYSTLLNRRNRFSTNNENPPVLAGQISALTPECSSRDLAPCPSFSVAPDAALTGPAVFSGILPLAQLNSPHQRVSNLGHPVLSYIYFILPATTPLH